MKPTGFIRRKELASGRRYYPVLVLDGKEHYFGGYARKRDADARLSRALQDAANGMLGREPVTLAAFSERWLTSKKKSLKPGTYVGYESAFRTWITPRLGGKYLADIKPQDVQAWVDSIDRAPSTVRKCYRYLRACLNQAVAWEVIDRSPCRAIDLPRQDNAELEFLEPSEVIPMLEVTKEPERGLFAVLAFSGLRLGEGSALAGRNVDGAIIVERSWSVHGFSDTKSGRKRRVPILPVLRDYLPDVDKDSLIFARKGLPLNPSTVERVFLRSLEAAGLKRVNVHSLRHTFASAALASGWSIKALQKALGHEDAALTLNTYGHLLREDAEPAIQRTSDLFTKKLRENDGKTG